ncbi:hypothetical protein JCM11491_004040 [Sporobolomyces phaffii]
MDATDTPPAATRPLALSFPLSHFSLTQSDARVRQWSATEHSRATLTTASVPERLFLVLADPEPRPNHNDVKLVMTFDLHVANGFSSHRLEKLVNRLEYWARTFQIPRRISDKRAIEVPREGDDPIPRVKTPEGWREGVTSTMMCRARPVPNPSEWADLSAQGSGGGDPPKGQSVGASAAPHRGRSGKGTGKDKGKRRADDNDDDDEYVEDEPAGDSEEGEVPSDGEDVTKGKNRARATSVAAKKMGATKSDKAKGKERADAGANAADPSLKIKPKPRPRPRPRPRSTGGGEPKKAPRGYVLETETDSESTEPLADEGAAKRKRKKKEDVAWSPEIVGSAGPSKDGQRARRQSTVAKSVSYTEKGTDSFEETTNEIEQDEDEDDSDPSEIGSGPPPLKRKRNSGSRSRSMSVSGTASTSTALAPKRRTKPKPSLPSGPPSQRRRERTASPTTSEGERRRRARANREYRMEDETSPAVQAVQQTIKDVARRLDTVQPQLDALSRVIWSPQRLKSVPLSNTIAEKEGGGGAAGLVGPAVPGARGAGSFEHDVDFLMNHYSDTRAIVLRLTVDVKELQELVQGTIARSDKGKGKEPTRSGMDLDEDQHPNDVARRVEALESSTTNFEDQRAFYETSLASTSAQITGLEDRIARLEKEKADWLHADEARRRTAQEREQQQKKMHDERERERIEDRERLARLEGSMKTLLERSPSSIAACLPPLPPPPPPLRNSHKSRTQSPVRPLHDANILGGGAAPPNSEPLHAFPLPFSGSSSSISSATRTSARLATAPVTVLSRRRSETTGASPLPRATSKNPNSKVRTSQPPVAPSRSNPGSPYGTRGRDRAKTTEPSSQPATPLPAPPVSMRSPARRDHAIRSMHTRRSAAHESEVLGSLAPDSTATTGPEAAQALSGASPAQEPPPRRRDSPEPELTPDQEALYASMVDWATELGTERLSDDLKASFNLLRSAREQLQRG